MTDYTHSSRRFPRPYGWIAFSLILIASGCAGAGKTATRAPSQPVFAGMWEGSFDAGEMAGGMKLVLNKDGESYSGVLQVDVQGESISGDVYNFESEGNTFTFASYFEGFDIMFRGAMEAEKMTGTFEAFMGSDAIGGGTFSFTRKP